MYKKENRKKYIQHIRFLIYIFLFFQGLFNSINTGASYDIAGFRFGSGIVLNKILLLFTNPFSSALTSYNEIEFYGQVLPVLSYIFGHSVNIIFGKNLIENFSFLNSDDVIYTFIYIFLVIYFILLLEIIFRLLSKKYSNSTSAMFILLLVLIPSINGQLFFNIKDIPFALHLYIAYLCYYFYVAKDKKFIYVVISFTFVILSRISGLAMLALIVLIVNSLSNKNFIKEKKFYKENALLFLYTIFSTLILSPSSWRQPHVWLVETFKFQFFHKWSDYTLTNGEFYFSQKIDITYLLKWFFYRLPIFYIILFSVAFIFILKNYKNISQLVKGNFLFIIFFLILFQIFSPTAYDGDRQYLFLYPFIVGSCLEILIRFDNLKLLYKNIAILLFLSYTAYNFYGLQSYTYIYLNELSTKDEISYYCAENIDGCGNWYTDFQGLSGKNLAKSIDDNFKDEDILICRPEHVFGLYLDSQKNNIIPIRDFDKSKYGSIYVATLHRPRKSFDSCNNLIKEFDCTNIFEESVLLRGEKVSLSYLSKCDI